MSDLYSKPLKVYFALGFLALWGVISGFQLPISLFPQSDQATISVNFSYGNQTADQFSDSYGRNLESSFASALVNRKTPDEVTAQYNERSVSYKVKFGWGVDPIEAQKQVEIIARNATSSLSEEVKRSLNVRAWKENQGFYAASFFSNKRSLDELYKILQPTVAQLGSKVPDANSVGLYNPNRKEIRVTLSPEKMALYEISSVEVERAIEANVSANSGGSVRLGEETYQLILPRHVDGIEDLKSIPIKISGSSHILLQDIASVALTPSEDIRQKFRTSGVESLILFGDPKEGGNIKQMSDDISKQVALLKSQWPEDVEFRVLVNPADFINQSVKSVIKEVGIAAFLAVVVLFLFIGSIKNVITAAIEIPLSLVMAFILMKLTGMNLNLISLGGLALSAGMNVDASVVVMENIFRYFEKYPEKRSPQDRLALVLSAVQEVKMPIIASTMASLVVFIPLVMTSGLTNSLLGDLAKAVIFSHGLSALVALILVPTIRLQLMKNETNFHFQSPIEKEFRWLEAKYANLLQAFLLRPRAQLIFFSSLAITLVALVFLVVPRLNTEVIGKPETDWLIVGFNSSLLNSPKQADSEMEILENDLMQKVGDDVDYTFAQVNGSSGGMVMMRLRNKSKVEALTKFLEENYVNTPTMNYWIDQWNPSELSIPDPPHFQFEIVGGTKQARVQVANDLRVALNETKTFSRVNNQPNTSKRTAVKIDLFRQAAAGADSRGELTHLLRTATQGHWVSDLNVDNQLLPIELRMEKQRTQDLDQLKALPINVAGKILSIGALGKFSYVEQNPTIYRQNDKELVVISGKANKSDLPRLPELKKQAQDLFTTFKAELVAKSSPDSPTLLAVDAERELTDALRQLKWAILLSIVLIFLTMVFQFGDVIHSLLVLVAIPLGFIGVVVSLFVFKSTLSLNSGLGTILLNGIAVANSIILVDFMRRLTQEGYSPMVAAVEASKARLRPILMTSITTVLGMLPVALGLGEGGKILQPLGIAVCGGLWISTLLTLFAVPCLQYLYLQRKNKTAKASSFQMENLDFTSSFSAPSSTFKVVEDRCKGAKELEFEL